MHNLLGASDDDYRCLCRSHGRRLCPVHQRMYDEDTLELDTRELPPYDDDCEDTLPDAGAEKSHQ